MNFFLKVQIAPGEKRAGIAGVSRKGERWRVEMVFSWKFVLNVAVLHSETWMGKHGKGNLGPNQDPEAPGLTTECSGLASERAVLDVDLRLCRTRFRENSSQEFV